MALVLGACSKDNDEPSNPTNFKTTAIFNPKITYGSMTDQDGNVYKTVTIGTQTWMAENLRTTKYNDGTSIVAINSSNEWSALSTGAYCNCKNTENNGEIATYGRLYNWYAVNTGKLAPKGWHVPTFDELSALITYLGGETEAGGKLKETGNTHWTTPNLGATNEVGFTALPAGLCEPKGTYSQFGAYGTWWCATGETNSCWSLSIGYMSCNAFLGG
ncbi:MAG TPA: fibrobacter succinogenes major paralogous domain-containing protein, partial [Paludibacter sp.]|nr:fibrobacter succinogenes major paralogous domain-containing protein [Paludibacter sp.]